MIKEAYCSFEVSKLLKEKGFDKFIDYGWDEQLFDKEHPRGFSLGFDNKEHWISCPTHQMAMKWLREEKNIIINVWYNSVDYAAEYFEPNTQTGIGNFVFIGDEYYTYEEAVEAALKYVLKNLI